MLTLPHNCLKIVNSERARFRLLYVGADLDFLRALRKVLTKPECHIVSCPHVGSAIDFLKGNPRYDLLIFELELPRPGIDEASAILIPPRAFANRHGYGR